MHISTGTKINNMHSVTCLLNNCAEPNLIVNDVLPVDWLFEISSKEMLLLYLRQESDLTPKETSLLFTSVKNLVIDVLLRTAFIDKQTLFIPPDEQKVIAPKSTPVAIVKQHNVSADAVITKKGKMRM